MKRELPLTFILLSDKGAAFISKLGAAPQEPCCAT